MRKKKQPKTLHKMCRLILKKKGPITVTHYWSLWPRCRISKLQFVTMHTFNMWENSSYTWSCFTFVNRYSQTELTRYGSWLSQKKLHRTAGKCNMHNHRNRGECVQQQLLSPVRLILTTLASCCFFF